MVPELVLHTDKKPIFLFPEQLAQVQAELRLGIKPASDLTAELVGPAMNVFGMAFDGEGQLADSEGIGPVDVEHKAVRLSWGAPIRDPSAGIDVSGQVGIQKGEARQVPGRAQAGQKLDDLGVHAAVDTADQRKILDRSDLQILLQNPAQAQGQIPFAVDFSVVEAVVLHVLDEVGKEEALAVLPAQGVLYSQDEGILVGVRKRVFEMAVLKMHLRRTPLNQGCGRRGRQQEHEG